VEYGSSSPAQLTVHALKRPYTVDFYETQRLDTPLKTNPRRYKLYLLGTHESDEKMESVYRHELEPLIGEREVVALVCMYKLKNFMIPFKPVVIDTK